MILEKYLMPDLVLPAFDCLTVEMLVKHGIKAVICDIDNTLATYAQSSPPDGVTKWIGELRDNGIKVAFVSNNNAERVDRFNESLGCTAYSGAHKPSPKEVLSAIRDCGTTAEYAVLLGDQLLTDVMAAKRAGIPAVVVPPIKDKTTLFFRVKRLIEKPYMKKYNAVYGGRKDF